MRLDEEISAAANTSDTAESHLFTPLHGIPSPLFYTSRTRPSSGRNINTYSSPGRHSSTSMFGDDSPVTKSYAARSHEPKKQPPCNRITHGTLEITFDLSMNPVRDRKLRQKTEEQKSMTNTVRRLRACEYHKRAKKVVWLFSPSGACPGDKLTLSPLPF
jgi:hypothetical protein